jgi:hypothetical protein
MLNKLPTPPVSDKLATFKAKFDEVESLLSTCNLALGVANAIPTSCLFPACALPNIIVSVWVAKQKLPIAKELSA